MRRTASCRLPPGQRHRPGIEHRLQIRVIDLIEQFFESVYRDPDVVVILQAEHNSLPCHTLGGLAQSLDTLAPVTLKISRMGRIAAENADDLRPQSRGHARQLRNVFELDLDQRHFRRRPPGGEVRIARDRGDL